MKSHLDLPYIIIEFSRLFCMTVLLRVLSPIRNKILKGLDLLLLVSPRMHKDHDKSNDYTRTQAGLEILMSHHLTRPWDYYSSALTQPLVLHID